MKLIKNLAEEICQAREQRGLSRAELGSMIGVSEKGIVAWEICGVIPKVSNFKKLSDVLELDFESWEPVLIEYHSRKRSNLDNKLTDKHKKLKNRPVKSIADICWEAAGMGMSYGQYVAWKERTGM